MPIIDGLAADRLPDAVGLVFEYMAATLAEAGRREPVSIGELPVALRRECEDLAACYAPPGALFVAYRDGRPAGCVVRRVPRRAAGRMRGGRFPDPPGRGSPDYQGRWLPRRDRNPFGEMIFYQRRFRFIRVIRPTVGGIGQYNYANG